MTQCLAADKTVTSDLVNKATRDVHVSEHSEVPVVVDVGIEVALDVAVAGEVKVELDDPSIHSEVDMPLGFLSASEQATIKAQCQSVTVEWYAPSKSTA